MSDVSVIVLAHNVREELLTCLASIEEHGDGLVLETIVVDNGSTDGTARAVAEGFPEATLIRRERNEGVSARNHGLRAARGRMLMFLDSDARLTHGALPELAGFLGRNPEVGLVAPRLLNDDGSLQLSVRRFPPPHLPLLRRPPLRRFFDDGSTVRHHLMADEPHDRTREVEYAITACVLFTREALERAGDLDESVFYGPEDIDFCLRVRRAGLKVVYHPAASAFHSYRRSTNERPLSLLALRSLTAFARFQWKWRRERAELAREGREMDRRAELSSFDLAAAVSPPSASIH
jgi:N-acetylglucosaminyl-diphospho-decaprenol L-rhamnosyltransferase